MIYIICILLVSIALFWINKSITLEQKNEILLSQLNKTLLLLDSTEDKYDNMYGFFDDLDNLIKETKDIIGDRK